LTISIVAGLDAGDGSAEKAARSFEHENKSPGWGVQGLTRVWMELDYGYGG